MPELFVSTNSSKSVVMKYDTNPTIMDYFSWKSLCLDNADVSEEHLRISAASFGSKQSDCKSFNKNLARLYRNVCRSNGCPLSFLSETLQTHGWLGCFKSIYYWIYIENNKYIPRPSKGVKFQPLGLFLVLKALKFQTRLEDSGVYIYILPSIVNHGNQYKWLFQLDGLESLAWKNGCFTKHPFKPVFFGPGNSGFIHHINWCRTLLSKQTWKRLHYFFFLGGEELFFALYSDIFCNLTAIGPF